MNIDCSSGATIAAPWTMAMFLATGDSAQNSFVSADGRTMEGSLTFPLEPGSDDCIITSEWHFTAEREP
jgi:hypothetical protein